MKRAVVLVALLVTTLALVPPADAQQPTLVVTGYGGRWSEVMKKALVEPFEKKHGVKVEVVTGITTEWVAKLLAAGPDNPPYDVVFGNEPAFPIPRERGFFEKRNETLAPNIKNLYPKALIGDTSLAMFWGRIGLAYRTDLGLKKPTSWKDFWDEAYAGKRGHLRHRQHARHQLPLHGREALRQGLLRRRRRGRRHQARPAQARGLHRHGGEAARAEGGRDGGAPRRLDLRPAEAGHPGGLGRAQRGPADPRPDRPGHARLEEEGAGVEAHRRLPLARGAARLRHRALLEPDQPDGQGARRTWRRRSSAGRPTWTSSCSSTGPRSPSSGRSGPRSGTGRCVDRRRGPRQRHRHADRSRQALRLDARRSTACRSAWLRASSSRCSAPPAAARPPRCARWPASSRRTPARWRSTTPWSPASPRTGGTSGWCSSTTRSSRIAPSRRTWPSACACSAWTEGGDRAAGGRGARPRPAPGLRRALSAPALGRRAAAGRAGAGAHHAAGGAPARRAARRARQEAARPHEDRAHAPAARGGHHHDLRDPRPGGGAHHVRPHRGDASRARRAGGPAARALRDAGDRVRGGLHRQHQPALGARRGRRTWWTAAARRVAATGGGAGRHSRRGRAAAGADPARPRTERSTPCCR